MSAVDDSNDALPLLVGYSPVRQRNMCDALKPSDCQSTAEPFLLLGAETRSARVESNFWLLMSVREDKIVVAVLVNTVINM